MRHQIKVKKINYTYNYRRQNAYSDSLRLTLSHY